MPWKRTISTMTKATDPPSDPNPQHLPRRLSTERPQTINDDSETEQVRPALPPAMAKRSSLRSIMLGGAGSQRRHFSRPATSPHATHAMFLQLQEYHDRLEKALSSTYQAPLKPPRRPRTEDEDNIPAEKQKRSYCRARILQSNRECFQTPKSELAGAPPPSFATAVGVKDCVLPKTGDVYVSFHQTTPRTSDYLYGNNQESLRRMRLLDSMASAAGVSGSTTVVSKDHFALGPGQYDVHVEKPSGAAAASKFSPSDRFHENYSTDHPGPGQYLTSETLVVPRSAAAVFSQMPRQTDIGSMVSPTANVVSSYYYVPDSDFTDGVASTHRTGWSRTTRFKSHGRHDRALLRKPPRPCATDYVAKNIADLRTRSRSEVSPTVIVAEPTSQKPRSSLVATLTNSSRATQATASSVSRELAASTELSSTAVSLHRMRASISSRDRDDLTLQSWITIAYIASFQGKLTRYCGLLAALRRIRLMQRRKRLTVTFASWKKLDMMRNRQYAAQLIVRNAFRLRLWVRIEKKRRHANILRQFLGGLSIDVRFALAMKRIKRKIQLIQRWWRHVQLMVRAREEALYHKWIAVENRMRLEYINQMPHLQRIFQPPAGTTAASNAMGSMGSGASFSAQANTHASDLQLHKLLNLPDQRRWFTARFVLSSDGSLRAYATEDNEMLVEVKHFRCHYHDISGSGFDEGSITSQSTSNDHRPSYSTYTNATWKPFLMLFRQGAFRFVLVTSLSPLPTEILSWKDKLERLMVNPTGSLMAPSYPGGSSMSFSSTSPSASASYSDLSFFGSVGDLVEVSMQSGILAPALTAETQNHHRQSRFQSRVRSIRQRNRSGVSVADGMLSYYVVDLLKDLPKVPSALVWATIRDKLREKRKAFRAEIYRYKLEMFHFQQHQEQVRHMHVLEKFRDFFTLERPRRPHFRSLISTRKMESLVRSTSEQVKSTTPANPRVLLDAK